MKLRKLLNEMPKYNKDTQMYSDFLKANNVVIKKDKIVWKGEEIELSNDGYYWQVGDDFNDQSKSKLSAIFWYVKNRK